MANDLVAYSRAGDTFHYRWAARRCLKLVYPCSPLQKIVIEGSDKEGEKAGEYVIDVTEYADIADDKISISYYQLKHTTVQQDKPFILSDLKDTFIGFSKRFLQHKNEEISNIENLSFVVITNRKIDDNLKKNISYIINNKTVNKRFLQTIEEYTKLSTEDLKLFCSILKLEDSEGDYNIQREDLRIELTQLIAGTIDNTQLNNLICLVQEKVLPDSNNLIIKEDVLKRFGISSIRSLYPAPTIWEKAEKIVKRKLYEELKSSIYSSSTPIIIHATGGIGKSVFCQEFTNSLENGSLCISYDCFGAGSYRNRSEPRHKHRDALVQIVNELASMGLCNPVIPLETTLKEDIVRKFLIEIETSVKSLQKTNSEAQLFLLIDAADNAEMAAKDFNEACFAHELLREKVPHGCKLVFLCRTERISLLKPQSSILLLELPPFTIEETADNLKKWFPNAGKNDSLEFHRLTSGNPRVQANALAAAGNNSINQLLESLGSSVISVDKQIEKQLNLAISKIKDSLTEDYSNNIDSICVGLSCLPPHIPIEVLSKVANVSIELIKSFVSDIGRPLWLSDSSIQFRDEPTETWFRSKFLVRKEDYEMYIKELEPIAHEISYVAEVLPQLYLQAKQYDKLIEVALSDNFLPSNPIEARNIRVQRLQFAFKAALKSKKQKDSVMLAMRAGEEVAGNERQTELLRNNIDLLILLQSKEKVQEIAFKSVLTGSWQGSENIYSASLLSGIKEYRGEANSYLRASENWLNLFFNEQKTKNKRQREDGVSNQDILELAYAYLNMSGSHTCVKFLLSLTPKETVFSILRSLISRLIDIGRFKEINEIISYSSRDPYFVVAITHELSKIGIIPDKSKIEICLDLLCSSRCRIQYPRDSFNNYITPAIISFLEACLHRNLPASKILRVFRYYIPVQASSLVYDSYFSKDREIFLQALAIKMLINGESEVDLDEISPKEFKTQKDEYKLNNDKNKFEEIITRLIPWYLLRIKIINRENIEFLDAVFKINDASKKSRINDFSRDSSSKEIAGICSSILILSHDSFTKEQLEIFYNTYLRTNSSFNLTIKLDTLRAVNRLSDLYFIKQDLELSVFDFIKTCKNEESEEIAKRYILLSRAVLVNSIDDASVYFEEAVNIISKFGDEIRQRWDAIVALAKRIKNTKKELTYRFIRCAELVGENVYQEKHWNRSESIAVCTRMNPGVGISALSRWRDRDIGRFEYQFQAVLYELVKSKLISPTVGWSLTRFFDNHDRNDYLSTCLDNESIKSNKQGLLEDAVDLLQVEGAEKESWLKLKETASKFNLDYLPLNTITNFYSQNKTETKLVESKIQNEGEDDNSKINWNILFDGLEITTNNGFEKLIERYNLNRQEDDWTWNISSLLKEVVKRVDEENILKFFDIILLSDNINLYDIRNIFSYIPQEWKNKISFRKKLPDIIFNIGKKYAIDLSNKFSFDYCFKDLNILDGFDLANNLKHGVFKGLENENELNNAESLWGYVDLVSSFVDLDEVEELTDYSLSRFELHMEDSFGDGCWDSWLDISDDINKNIAGFIWSALSSPKSSVRWNAAHCVKSLAKFNCSYIIDALIEWLQHDKVDAFGCKQFPFYNLHAKLYLLIAFTRISVEHPELLLKHKSVFVKYALSESHILIQIYASKITLNIENSFVGTYSEEIILALLNVGKSNLPIENEKYGYTTDSYWHKQGNVKTDIDFFFGLDFDDYWFEPLGEVFGIPGKQVEELAAELIVNEWGYSNSWKYNDDPRAYLWNKYNNDRETYHSHGGHPKTDNLSFYLSYHSMLSVASMLINKMPVIKTTDWYEDEWKEWLSRHLLTRDDGKWLSDSRDHLPIKRPKWIDEKTNDNWFTDLTSEDFRNCLTIIEDNDVWINVKGGWVERDDMKSESFTISSALVSKKASYALLRALATCEDPFDYKLPNYREEDMEIEQDIFKLKGWIKRHSTSKGLDEFDPYADNIDYPSYSIGKSIVEKLNLSVDSESKRWYDNNSNSTALICENWSSYRIDKDKYPDQSGMKLKASLSFLKHMCQTLDCELILDVCIAREVSNDYERNKREYRKPKYRTFILASDGELRTTK